jgi:hypothetical protein
MHLLTGGSARAGLRRIFEKMQVYRLPPSVRCADVSPTRGEIRRGGPFSPLVGETPAQQAEGGSPLANHPFSFDSISQHPDLTK